MRSESIAELTKALCNAQGMMKDAPKDASNPFFKSRYSDLSSCVEAARVPLSKNELAVIQAVEHIEGGWALRTTLSHSSGQYICSLFPLYPKDTSSQQFGSALSYARRYSFQGIINQTSGIEDDDGNAERSVSPARK